MLNPCNVELDDSHAAMLPCYLAAVCLTRTKWLPNTCSQDFECQSVTELRKNRVEPQELPGDCIVLHDGG